MICELSCAHVDREACLNDCLLKMHSKVREAVRFGNEAAACRKVTEFYSIT